eukprot:jgi/Picsp_1/6756/NSC_04097-R1_hypothetical protein CHLNCDRAFT_139869 [Chlorella variabilis]
MDAAAVDVLTYRQAQTECKRLGLPAKGKQAELVERLKEYYSKNVDQQERSDVGTDAGREDRRKSLDSARTISMHTAVTTPLPPHPKHKRSSLEGQSSTSGSRKKKAVPDRIKAGGSRAGVSWGRVALLLVASGIALALVPYCREHRCADKALEKAKSVNWSQLTKGSEWIQGSEWLMGQWEKVSNMEIWGTVKEASIKACDGALAKGRYIYHVTKVHAGIGADKIKDLLADGIERMEHMLEKKKDLGGQGIVINKKLTQLNSAVLGSIAGKLEGSSWDSVKSSIEDIWALEKIAETKANTAVFVCESKDACNQLADELAGAADPEFVLKLELAGHKDAIEKGEIQSQLVGFLEKNPRGVVLLPHVNHIPLHLLTVLNNAMGEAGSLLQNGKSVSTEDATFLMTMEVSPGILKAENAVELSLEAKKFLQKEIVGSMADEASQGIASALRRRIDVVVPYSSRV